MRPRPQSLLAAVLTLASLVAGGCGSNSSSSGENALAQQQQLQQARSDAARTQRQEDRIKQLEQQAKRPGGGTGSQAAPGGTTTSSTAPSSSVDFSSCDANIAAAGGASCAFAENTFYEYYNHQGEGSFSVYSPTTGSSYTVSCGPNGPNVVCTNDQGAATRFAQNAIDAYSQAQADHYAATHNVGH